MLYRRYVNQGAQLFTLENGKQLSRLRILCTNTLNGHDKCRKLCGNLKNISGKVGEFYIVKNVGTLLKCYQMGKVQTWNADQAGIIHEAIHRERLEFFMLLLVYSS